MGKLYADAQGHILRLLQSADEEARYGPPPGTAFTLDFDETTNGAVLSALASDWNAHDMVGGVLRRNGQPILVAPDSQYYGARKQLQAAKQTIVGNAAGLASYKALTNPTAAQTAAALKLAIDDIQALTVILRALIREAN